MNSSDNSILLCPHCESDHIRRSRSRWPDKLWGLLGQRPFRCYDCGQRFRASQSAAVSRAHAPLPPAMDVATQCPQCGHKVTLQLTPGERQLAESEGWVVSCPACAVLYASHKGL